MTPGYANPIEIGIGAESEGPGRTIRCSRRSRRSAFPTATITCRNCRRWQRIAPPIATTSSTIEKLAGLGGDAAAADRIIALETALSQAQWSAADRRDVDKTNNPMTRAQVSALAPQFNWDASLAQRGLGNTPQVIVREPSAIVGRGEDPRLDAALDLA